MLGKSIKKAIEHIKDKKTLKKAFKGAKKKGELGVGYGS